MLSLKQVVAIAMLITLLASNSAMIAYSNPDTKVDQIIEKVITSINFDNIINHIRALSSFESRYTGYPGSEKAAEYIYNYFKTLGLNTEIQEYEVAIPLDVNSKIRVLKPVSMEFKVYTFFPNHVQTCKGVYEGRLVYVGKASLEELNKLGVPVNGSIALTDFNSYDNWLYLMRLGARAAIFIEPSQTIRSEAERKYIDIPLKFPRVYIRRSDANYLLDLIRKYGNGNVTVQLVVNMTWTPVKAKNIIAVVNGSDPQAWREVVAVVAYYDASSYIPGLAPGASETCGIAALLEFARLLKENPPRRSVMLIALSGHAQALAGARNFVWYKADGNFVWYYSLIGKNDNETKTPYTIKYVIGFDISTETDAIAVVSGGSFYGVHVWFNWYGWRELYRWIFEAKRYGEYDVLRGLFKLGSEELRRRYPLVFRVYAQGLLPENTDLSVFVQFPQLFDASVIGQVGIWDLTFTTALTARPLLGTPLDTFDRLRLENLRPQVTFAFILSRFIIDDVEWIDYKRAAIQAADIPGHVHISTGGLGFVVSVARVGRWDIQRGWYDYNWSGILSDRYRMILHVKILERPDLFGHEWFEMSSNGTFTLKGLAPSVGWAVPLAKYQLLPFVIDVETGDIVYAPDFGIYGSRAWPFGFTFYPSEEEVIDGSGREPVNLAVFKVGATVAIHDLMDPRSLLSPVLGARLEILDPAGLTLKAYSYMISEPPTFEQAAVRRITLADPTSGYEAVAFIPEGECAKIVLYGGPAIIGVLTNQERGICAVGGGYVDTAPTAFNVARDLEKVVEERVSVLRGAGLFGAGAESLREAYSDAKERLAAAESSLRRGRYGEFYVSALQAWYFMLLAYERSKGLIIDAGSVMVAFFLLAVPFAFLFERLVFHYEGKRRVAALVAVSASTLALLYALHPGFRVSPTAALTALGALICVLVIPVLFMMFSDFAETLREIRAAIMGPAFAVGDKVALTAAALSAGVENLRRRPARTVLTVISIALVTFAMLTFMTLSPTWVTERVRIEMASRPRYTGVLVTRREPFAPINPLLIELLKLEYGSKSRIAPRAWVPIQNLWVYNATGAYAAISGIIGLSREEAHALKLQETAVESLRPWFVIDEAYECYVTKDLADSLSLKLGDDIYLYGVRLVVTGVIEPRVLRSIYDLDGQPPVPFDPRATGPVRERAYWGVVYVPYELAIKLGGYPYSVAIVVENGTLADEIARSLSKYVGFYVHNVYATPDDSSYLYLRREILFIGGWQFVAVPLSIGALLLLSVTMGVLYERTKDLYVYSTVGASPREAAFIFLGEIASYAFLSAPIGYMLALSLGPSAVGPLFNYASSALMISLLASLASVLLASVYPAYKASRVITPSLERKWRPPTRPRGDRWDIPLPFVTRSADEAKAIVVFASSTLKASGGEASPYTIVELKYGRRDVAGAPVYEAEMLVRLRPYEQGVAERVVLRAERAARVARFNFILLASHVSGPRELWLANHLRFADEVRKRLLLWRTLEESIKANYLERAREVFQ